MIIGDQRSSVSTACAQPSAGPRGLGRGPDAEDHPESVETPERVFVRLVVARVDDADSDIRTVFRAQDVQDGVALVPSGGARLTAHSASRAWKPASRIVARGLGQGLVLLGLDLAEVERHEAPFASTQAPSASIRSSSETSSATRRS